MNKINARSPYLVYRDAGGYDQVRIKLWIYTGIQTTDKPSEATYQLISTFINDKATVNIAEVINDFIQVEFDGSYSQDNYWIDATVRLENIQGGPAPTNIFLRGFKGYGYFEEGVNPSLDQSVLISNDLIYKLDDEALNVPVDTENTVRVTFEDADGSTFTTPISSSTDSASQVQYVSDFVDSSKNFVSRVAEDGGTMSSSNCLDEFEDEVILFPTKRVIIESSDGTIEVLRVKNIEECKYEPHKLTFVNKFGVLQDLWFFKTSKLKMSVESEDYRANTAIDDTYSIHKHQYRTLYTTGKQTLSLSSGFYPESYNEVFKQLFLSEKVWINYKDQTLPINIKSKNMAFKTSLNDSLIDYKIDVEFAYDTINSIR